MATAMQNIHTPTISMSSLRLLDGPAGLDDDLRLTVELLLIERHVGRLASHPSRTEGELTAGAGLNSGSPGLQHQVLLDERLQVAVKHGIDITRLVPGSHV